MTSAAKIQNECQLKKSQWNAVKYAMSTATTTMRMGKSAVRKAKDSSS